MKGYIDGYNFAELAVQKYWQPPSTWSKEKTKQETMNRIFGGFLGSQKRDGALYVLLKDEDGNITLRGRSKSVSGEYIDKWDHLPHLHEWAAELPNGCCFLGEVYWVGHEGSNNTTSIMNCLTKKAIERQAKDENKMHYYIFDVLALNGTSLLKMIAKDRFDLIYKLSTIYPNPYVEFAEYKTGQELWDLLQKLLADGYEGIVITKEDSLYEPDKRPSKTTMKIKKELKQTIDVFFSGRMMPPAKLYTGKDVENWRYFINDVTGELLPEGEHYMESVIEHKPYTAVTRSFYKGFAGSLEIAVLDGDKEVSLGYISGLTDEIKANYKDYIHRVIEVGAMQLTPDGDRLRHGKMIGWRDDKLWTECSIDQLKSL